MKKGNLTYTFTKIIFLLLAFCTTSIAQTSKIIPTQSIQVHPTKPDRYLFEMETSAQVITLKGLQVGDHYQLLVNSYDIDSDCAYQVDAFTENEMVSPLSNEDDASSLSPNNAITFQASATTISFHLATNGCSLGKDNQAVLSLLNLACDMPSGKNPDMSELQKMAVLAVDYNYTTEQLIQDIFIGGGCFDVANVQAIGNTSGIGHFSQGAASVVLDEGVILESGNITNAPGPNNAGNAGNDLGTTGDPDLELLGAGTIYDAVGIEFDFTPTVPVVNFDYVFASEEYCEYVGSQFNDVFGFFISGPGFNGPFTNGAENIALIPATTTYVAINTVNHNQNTAYFNGNHSNCGQITNP
ncbi:MAG TPA: hypothetical protein ENJ45_02460, partial [Phaeodactylibacter sp.]|nr:hypothetical protein [Phaeodactylibacter sp.]